MDVGNSASRPTTGIAWLAGGEVGVAKTRADRDRRLACLPNGVRYAVIAIDGPLLPDHAALDAQRACEHIFVRDVFQKRCKPGMSHFGAGLELRRAAQDTRQHFESFADPSYDLFRGPYVVPAVEAFPNAFLGVLLSDGCFDLGSTGCMSALLSRNSTTSLTFAVLQQRLCGATRNSRAGATGGARPHFLK